MYEVTRDATGKEISRVEKSNTITKAPVTEVIAQGTKVKEPEESKVTVSEESKVESVGYETQYIEDPNMDSGTTAVKTPGQAGERTIVYEVARDTNGKELARVEKSDEITKGSVLNSQSDHLDQYHKCTLFRVDNSYCKLDQQKLSLR